MNNNTEAASVFPVPATEAEQEASGLKAGPEMPGDAKPVREGRYLRYFADADDWAFSEWRGEQWLRDGFFPSDVQNAPWRGGVLKAGNGANSLGDAYSLVWDIYANYLRREDDDVRDTLGIALKIIAAHLPASPPHEGASTDTAEAVTGQLATGEPMPQHTQGTQP